jgi:hypothetical protein
MLFVRRTLWLVFVAGIVGVTAEIMARIDDAVRSGVPLLASPAYTDLTMQDSLGTRGRPHARFEKWKLNGAGFRSQEVSLLPPARCTRVAVMGASETFGYAESPGKEYPAQLADSLNRAGCYEVLNTAVTGLPTTGQIQLWENWVSRFEPSVVVIYASPAFYLSDNAPEFAKLKPRSASPISNPFEARLLGRLKDRIDYPDFLQRRRVMKRIAYETAGKPENWLFRTVPADRLALFQEHLDSLVESVRARGAVPVLVTHAMRFGNSMDQEDHDLLRSWRQFSPRATEDVLVGFERKAAAAVRDDAKRQNVPLVDVDSVMTGHRQWFADFAHFTDGGAGIIAGRIARTVEQIKLPTPASLAIASPKRNAEKSGHLHAAARRKPAAFAQPADATLANRIDPR